MRPATWVPDDAYWDRRHRPRALRLRTRSCCSGSTLGLQQNEEKATERLRRFTAITTGRRVSEYVRGSSHNGEVRWTAAVLIALVGCTTPPASVPAVDESWDAPPARWVSDLGQFEQRNTYNTISSVSDGGRWVVFASHVRDRPSRLFLVDTKRDHVRQIDDSFDGTTRTSEGMDRYNTSFAGQDPQITPDGRFVVFTSPFSNLVRADDNRAVDVFVYDRVARKTRVVSRSSGGAQSNGDSGHPSISPSGRFVVFDSRATNFSPDDKDRKSDVYLTDLREGTTELVSVGPSGKGDDSSIGPDVSDDGDRVSFVSSASNLVDNDANGTSDVFVRVRGNAATIRASVTSKGDEFEAFEMCESATCNRAGAGQSQISGNGEVVVFTTPANGLVPEDRNYNADIFAHELDSGVTERVSVRDDGRDPYGPGDEDCGKDPVCASNILSHSPSLSRDGGLVYFISEAPQITDEDDDEAYSGEEVYVRDRARGSTLVVSRYRDDSILHSTNWYTGEISADGRWLTYSCNSMKLDGPRGDQDPGPDVFLQRLPKPLGSGKGHL